MKTRDFKFKNKEELEKRVNEYFEYCEVNEKPCTISGLAYFLGVNRRTVVNYANREAYGDVIERARDRVLMDMEEGAMVGKYNPAITIFGMKNNFEMSDKTEVKQEVDAEIKVKW